MNDEPFTRKDLVTIQVSARFHYERQAGGGRREEERKREIELNACFVSFVHLQDPHNLSARDLTKFDYVKTGKTAVEAKEVDRLSGINVGASGSAARILEEVAKKVSLLSIRPSS